MSTPAGDASLAAGFARAPLSLGWVTTHALEGSAGSAVGFDAVTMARAVAEGMRTLPKGAPDPEKPWHAFAAPFRAASEHLQAIRHPVPGMADMALAGIGAAVAEAGLPGTRNRETGRSSSTSAKPAGSLAGIGAAAADAAGKAGSVSRAHTGSWVETGNPSLDGIGAAAAGILAGLESGSGNSPAADALPKRQRGKAPVAGKRQPVARPSTTSANGLFADLLQRVERALQAAASSTGREAPISGSGTPAGKSAAESPRRAPFIDPAAPETQARFRDLLVNGPSADGAPADSLGNATDTVSPVSPSSLGPKPVPAAPDLAGILADLDGTGPGGQAVPGRAGTGPGWQPDPFSPGQESPAQALFPGANAPSRPQREFPAAPPTAATAPAKPAELEWLDSEDDLAARLHSLLRRQARRRGVDLA